MRKTYSESQASEKSAKTLYRTAVVFLTLCALALMSAQVWNLIDFNRHCSGHLKRAADANSIPLAISELETAVRYMEQNKLTEGYTSVLYETPDQDIGFWYKNINSALKDLKTLDPNASPLEKSNVLLKLRETLLDHSGRTEQVTTPRWISIFPHNIFFAVAWLFLACASNLLWFFYYKKTGIQPVEIMLVVTIIVLVFGTIVVMLS